MNTDSLRFLNDDGRRLRYLAERVIPATGSSRNPGRLLDAEEHEAAIELARMVLDAYAANIEIERRIQASIERAYTNSAGGCVLPEGPDMARFVGGADSKAA